MKSEMQFNWIFVIIAGAIILTFFVGFTLKFRSLQEEKLSVELLINLDNALFNLQSSPYNTFDVLTLPKELELTCENFKIGNRDYDNTKLIFSPKRLKDEVYVWYKPFNFPFKVENFYYIIPSKDRFYLIVGDQISKEFAQGLIDDLPEKLKQNVFIETTKQVTGKNIFIDSQGDMNDIKIIIQGDKISINYNNKLYDDVNQESVYGIMFSDDFDCNYNKLKSRLDKTISSYRNKATLLQNSDCNYSPFIQYLNRLKDLKYNDIKPIRTLNQNLVSLNCPALY